MSWIKQTKLTWLQSVAVRVLKAGKVPSHLAVIMDGNRRFARKQNMRSVEGHVQGFDKLAEVLYWCSELGVTEVTVYAFSIENFKRSKDEVEGLLDLALQKLRNMLNEMDKIHEHGVCIRVLGNLSYLPVELQKVVAEVVHQTQANSRCFLNIFEKGVLSSNDVSEAALSHAMYSRKSRDPELLYSGLNSPYGICLPAILYYQRHCGLVEAFKSARPREWQSADDQSLQRFIDDVEARWQERLQLMRLGQTAQEVVVT
ncbi:hypothetical protein MTO96_010756 [Rhipicephalus appendiculatus]